MNPKNYVIASLAVVAAVQTSRARFYRKDALRLAKNGRMYQVLAGNNLLEMQKELDHMLFDEIIKDF